MNHHLLFLALISLLSSFSDLSYTIKLSYEVHIDNLFASGKIDCITCSSDGEFLVNKPMSDRTNHVSWTAKDYEDHTEQTCSFIDEEGNEALLITAFSGSWKLDEIIWKTLTYNDFIYDSIREEHTYFWGGSENGVSLYNFLTRKYELVVPTNKNHDLHAEIFVSNLFEDHRRISVICVEETTDHRLADEKGLGYRDSATWSIPETESVLGKLDTCVVGWNTRTPQSTKKSTESFIFTGFDGSWRFEEIVFERYTRYDFTYNPYSKQHEYLWGISKKGLSLYNFKGKGYQVVRGIGQ